MIITPRTARRPKSSLLAGFGGALALLAVLPALPATAAAPAQDGAARAASEATA